MSDIRTQNPANEAALASYAWHAPSQVDDALTRAAALHERWLTDDRASRLHTLLRLADLLETRVDRLAKLASEEMGKPIREARAEVRKSASVCRFYATHADDMLADRPVAPNFRVRYEPLGPVLAIMPWNFPYWQVLRVLAPAMALGNPLLLKHAPNVTGCALAMQALLVEAGAPEGALQTLLIDVDRVDPIIRDPRVAGVTLTGSEHAGAAVARTAGEAIKPVVLELGGSDPFIILADADLQAAIDVGVRARMQNGGQSCIAAKRFIVEAPLYDRFVRLFSERVQQLVCDDPAFESTDVGPLARLDLRDRVEAQVAASIGYGARLVCGGKRKSGRGFYFEPTVLADVNETMPSFHEEIFGPVASVILAQDADDAIRLANATPFGLGASLWTQPERAQELAQRIRAGTVAINTMTASDPRVPFGGVRRSGVGRELSREGILSFANAKTIITGECR